MTNGVLLLFIAVVTVTGNIFGQQANKPSKYTSSVKLSVLSTRFMDKEEAWRRGGLAETDVAIKLRLETRVGIYLHSISDSVTPIGFVIEKRNETKVWRAGLMKGEVQTSPGVGHWLDEGFQAYAWVSIGAHSAIEWEEYRNSKLNAGKLLANSVFVKDADGKIFEIMSDFILVPTLNR